MTHRLTNICAENYCNRTLIVKVIVGNVVTCFLGHSVHVIIDIGWITEQEAKLSLG